jgi:Cytochrome c7 and related cytochrome c
MRNVPFAAVLLAGAAWAQFVPKAPPEQPIAFNHKVHVGLGVKCMDCHTIKAPGDFAGYPSEAACMGCHLTVKADSPAIQKLAAFAKEKKHVPWVRIYKLPKIVYFSHEVHHKQAGVDCAVCHGPVAEREAIGQEKSVAMADCMKCHDQYKASNKCDLCHDSH